MLPAEDAAPIFSATTLPDKLYDFVAYLGDRFGCTTVIHIRPESSAGSSPPRERFQVREFTMGRDRALPPLPEETVRHAVVLCTDIPLLEAGSAQLIAQIRRVVDAAPVCILTVPSCSVPTSAQELGSPSGIAPSPQKSCADVESMLRAATLNPAFVGTASLHDETRVVVAIIDQSCALPTLPGTRVTPPEDFRVVAIMTSYNEEDIIAQSIRRLIHQGIGVYLIDNWSTDATYELAAQFLHEGLLGLERSPKGEPTPYYDWESLLNRGEALSHEIQADWFIHHDADEVRLSPWPGVNLREAIYLADQAGFNCIDHTVLEFHPVDDDFVPGTDPESRFKWFEFGARYDHFQQVKAWKNLGFPVSLAASGGHDVNFPGRRVYPYKFLLKHYSIRSQAHGERKVFRDRKPRWRPDEKAKGWHVHYDAIREGHVFRRSPIELEYFDDTSFFSTYLIERLSGVGVGSDDKKPPLVTPPVSQATAERTSREEAQGVVESPARLPEQELDDELVRLRAALADAHERIREIEHQATRIVGSPTWQLLLRLDTLRQDKLLDRCVRAMLIARTQGLGAFAAKAAKRLWQESPAPLVPVKAVLPRTLPPMSVPPMTDPSGVTIMMRVFNPSAVTYQCLRSVIERSARGSYEIMAVDNGLADETRALLAHVNGLRIIRNEAGRGFLEACNQITSHARGAFLLFVNDDVVVLDGWLDALLDTVRHDPTIAAVGPQILHPDGRLLEAGGIVWNDGNRLSYGRGNDPLRPEYRYLRDVDYCSGVCLLVRRELFDRVNGFDLRFTPASYEDAALCFEVQRLGHRVVYQPKARVVRVEVEGDASGIDAAARSLRETFVREHAGALARRYPPAPRLIVRARDHRPGKRILFVDYRLPRYDSDSGAVRCLAILRILGDLGHKVTFIGDDQLLPEPYTDTLQQLGVEVLGGPLTISRYLEEHLPDFDLVILCRAPVAAKYLPAIVARHGHPPVVLDTVDLHYLREWRHAELAGDPTLAATAAMTRTVELSLIRQSNLTWVVSLYEADLLARDAPTARVEIVPNVHTVRSAVLPFGERRGLIFIGGFEHSPNVDAVLYFVQDIFPRIKRRIPDIHFRVIGPDAPSAIRSLASADVEIAGHVRNIEPILDTSRVSVAPLRYGAGMKGKIGQSLAYGLPVVTTTVGAEGLSLTNREHALIADEPQDFAAAVVELYLDSSLWARLSEQGRRHVDATLGYETVKTKVDAIIRRL